MRKEFMNRLEYIESKLYRLHAEQQDMNRKLTELRRPIAPSAGEKTDIRGITIKLQSDQGVEEIVVPLGPANTPGETPSNDDASTSDKREEVMRALMDFVMRASKPGASELDRSMIPGLAVAIANYRPILRASQ